MATLALPSGCLESGASTARSIRPALNPHAVFLPHETPHHLPPVRPSPPTFPPAPAFHPQVFNAARARSTLTAEPADLQASWPRTPARNSLLKLACEEGGQSVCEAVAEGRADVNGEGRIHPDWSGFSCDEALACLNDSGPHHPPYSDPGATTAPATLQNRLKSTCCSPSRHGRFSARCSSRSRKRPCRPDFLTPKHQLEAPLTLGTLFPLYSGPQNEARGSGAYLTRLDVCRDTSFHSFRTLLTIYFSDSLCRPQNSPRPRLSPAGRKRGFSARRGPAAFVPDQPISGFPGPDHQPETLPSRSPLGPHIAAPSSYPSTVKNPSALALPPGPKKAHSHLPSASFRDSRNGPNHDLRHRDSFPPTPDYFSFTSTINSTTPATKTSLAKPGIISEDSESYNVHDAYDAYGGATTAPTTLQNHPKTTCYSPSRHERFSARCSSRSRKRPRRPDSLAPNINSKPPLTLGALFPLSNRPKNEAKGSGGAYPARFVTRRGASFHSFHTFLTIYFSDGLPRRIYRTIQESSRRVSQRNTGFRLGMRAILRQVFRYSRTRRCTSPKNWIPSLVAVQGIWCGLVGQVNVLEVDKESLAFAARSRHLLGLEILLPPPKLFPPSPFTLRQKKRVFSETQASNACTKPANLW